MHQRDEGLHVRLLFAVQTVQHDTLLGHERHDRVELRDHKLAASVTIRERSEGPVKQTVNENIGKIGRLKVRVAEPIQYSAQMTIPCINYNL